MRTGTAFASLVPFVLPQTDAKTKLETWPEIAAHLGVAVRTAQTWERTQGMPIHRMSGDRPRVWAYTEELAAWQRGFHETGSLQNAFIPTPSEPVAAPKAVQVTQLSNASGERLSLTLQRHRWVVVWSVVAFLVGAFGVAFLWLPRTSEPAEFRLEQNRLLISDKTGHPIWEHAFPKFFLSWSLLPEYQAGLVRIGRLGTSGETSVLVNYVPSDAGEAGTTLYCFSHTGRELWKFTPGREVRTARDTFQNVYSTAGYVVLPDGRIVVASHHHVWYPTQLAILDSRGKLLAEYWHSGYLMFLKSRDLDGDGKPELIVAGINNGYHASTLLVLSPDDLDGAASQAPGDPTQLAGMAPAHEKVRILIPMSDIPRAVGMKYNLPQGLEVGPNQIEMIVQEEGDSGHAGAVHYTFDYKFHLVSVKPSDTFVHAHRELETSGVLKHAFSPAEIDELRKSVLVLRNDFQ